MTPVEDEHDMSKFWDKVLECDHKNFTTHYPYVSCSTPYCSAQEVHCKDCGVFIESCGCMSNNGMSGWSRSRHRAHERKKKGV